MKPSFLSRFVALVRVIPCGGCWEWEGETRLGYGRFWDGTRRASAHRWLYERQVGAVPDGLDLDHLCRNTACVNPSHLEPVTHRENVMRGTGLASANAVATHCKRGHPFSGDNLREYVGRNGRTHRSCVTCVRATKRKSDRKRREARRQ